MLTGVFSCFSQTVTINTNKYTIDQLINQVLINSPCVSGTNCSSKTGSFYGSSNGIGYFENSNPSFPFTNGVVLTTGDVSKVPSPNNTILSDGAPSWSGDPDLESNLLSQSGIQMNSINASYIEFDFQPKTPNFDFSFLFASEEYGTSQCNFSDAFAFLLKDMTILGPNLNLAVIPGTNIPVSVATIRDNTYNTNCSSVNASFFGAFNGNAFGPAINFNGQTVEMTASAVGLNINHVYRIKIVIADGSNNTGYDSAIFLKANSFNIGQNVLGLDYTSANQKAICPGNPLPIVSAAALNAGTTFIWKKEGQEFTPSQTGTSLDLNTIFPLISSGLHNYSLSYIEPGCSEIEDKISIEIYPKIGVIPDVPNIYACDKSSTSYLFDLTKNTKIIKAGTNQATNSVGILDDLPSTTLISYHLNYADALGNTNSIPSTYSILNSENGKIIYARIESSSSSCYEIRSFHLEIVSSPIISYPPPDIILCARNSTDNPIKANFNLNTQKGLILGSQNGLYNIISFHATLADANANLAPVLTYGTSILLSNSRTLWVRIENTSNPDCFVISSFQLLVNTLPGVDILNDVVVCSSYTLLPLTNLGSEYWSGTNGSGIHYFAGNNITTTKTLYVFNQSGSCTNQDSFKITISNLLSISPISSQYCSEFKLPSLPYGKYFTKSGGSNTTGNIELTPGTIINSPGINTLFVWYQDNSTSPSCQQENPFTITIIPFIPLTNYANQFSCNSYTLAADPNGGTYYSGSNKGLPILPEGTVISATTSIYVYKETNSTPLNCFSEKSFKVYIDLTSINIPTDVNSCSAYVLPSLTVGEYRTAAAGSGAIIPVGSIISSSTSLWYYIPGQTCTDNLQFKIKVNIEPLAIISDTPPSCDVYYLPAVAHKGNYFTGSLGTGSIRALGFPITSTQTIYFYDKAPTGSCYVEEHFLITINNSPLIDSKPVEVLKCGENYVLDELMNGKYYAFSGGPSSSNPELPLGTIITSSKTIFAYAIASTPNTCISEYSIAVTINKVNDVSDKFACNSYSLTPIVGLGDYYTATGGPQGVGIKLSPPYSPISISTDFYIYTQDLIRDYCFDEKKLSVIIYNTPIINVIPPIRSCEFYLLPPLVFPLNKYFSLLGGPSSSNIEKFPGDAVNTSGNIYAYSETGTSTTLICAAEKPIEITIIPKPIPILLDIPSICVDFKTGVIRDSHVISGFTGPRYSVDWKKEDGSLQATSPDFLTKESGKYFLTVTDLSVSSCKSNPLAFNVVKSSKPDSVSFTTSNWFTNNQTINILAIPHKGETNDFLYALDSGTAQKNTTFTNVSAGIHEINISDGNGCESSIELSIKLINSPVFFSPNGDGINDNWMISEMPNEYNYKILIFDRYGKLIKELLEKDNEWDGTYNGKPLPADDYWFTITFLENEILKEYKSHFSLIR